ncbi:hypothetical protein HYH03_003773 [Edaphochlamys debaryana]|uniref:Rhodanese domain-containing protein n=1 Tax=Edaphochlamys debaryana TaxID=47281 RepID=A0A836C484_9CHLO|nr:hypothetical protein HYH03_003773 [Edaphochlamys debaryana]|eukprot:KAG2498522.1 hypothetical protein HYH03_003773 [Edaphochlamys debaryana]
MQVAMKPTLAAAAPSARRAAPAPAVRSGARGVRRAAFGAARPQRFVAARASQQVANPEQRWDQQVVEGKVKNLVGKDVKTLLSEGWVLLDVRPPNQVAKARIVDAVEVPTYMEDPSTSLSTFIKNSTAFGMGGWWLGGRHMIPNDSFLAQVQSKLPNKSTKLIVGCQKGLRSLAACEQLSLAGYQTLGWINGGFDSCKQAEIPTVDNVDIRYAGIGGLSELIGWTEVQQEQGKNLGSIDAVIKFFAVILALDLLVFAAEYARVLLNGPAN